MEILEINPDNILNLQHIDKARREILSCRYRPERRTDIPVTEDVIVLEEFRSAYPISNILNYPDIYPVQLAARYNNEQACYHFVYIVSN